jgi:hypothetical protein
MNNSWTNNQTNKFNQNKFYEKNRTTDSFISFSVLLASQ